MQRYELYPNQVVMFRGQPAKVQKINPKWIVVQCEDGSRWNAAAASLSAPPAGTTFALKVAAAKDLTEGSVVRFVPSSGNATKYPGLYVVTKVGAGEYRLAKMGGDSGRYFRGVPATSLEEVSLSDVQVYLEMHV